MDKLHEQLTDKIRYWAKRKKVVLTHLPDRAGVNRSYFWKVMKGESSPTVLWLGKIADALDVRINDFFEHDKSQRQL